MSEVLSTADAKHLIHLCKTGRLFELQEWIAAGKSLRVPPTFKPNPLKVAIDTGFHSMVEFLARHERDQNLKNRALLQSVELKRLDFIQLLVANGADTRSVPFVEVLRAWEPAVIRYFIDQGADLITGSPFAVAFSEKIRTALRVWKECKDRFPAASRELQEQADQALRFFCDRCDLKWVSLLMWVGADPRSRGPTPDEEEPDNPDYFSSAMESAAHCEDISILKRLKPQPRDDLAPLLESAATFARTDVVSYLIQLGAEPNDRADGGSTAMQRCLQSFDLQSDSYHISYDRYFYSRRERYQAPRHAVSKVFDTLDVLLKSGAFWQPETARDVDSVRRSLYTCEGAVTSELVRKLHKNAGCSKQTLHDLLRTPAMQKHLTPQIKKLKSTGFDVRTAAQRTEDRRLQEQDRVWTALALAKSYDREKLYEEIWSQPIQHVAKKYNLSDVGLAKICRKLQIPRPGRGYWAIKAAGKPLPKRPGLPPLPSRPVHMRESAPD